MPGLKFQKYIFLILCLISNFTYAEFIISLRSPETKNDKREDYNVALVTLALEKTKTEYGDYRIAKIPPMNIARSFFSLEADKYPNMMIELSYQEKLEKNFDFIYVNFPIELGIVGYRVCFASPQVYEDLKKVQTLDELKQYSIGQGIAWADTEILRHNGLKVVEIGNFDSIFKLVELGRIDLFCRGANELQNEYESKKGSGNLLYDKSFVLRYSLPRFYYLHKNNRLARERIEKGLATAYQDGSINALWEKYFLESVKFTKLKQRKIFDLQNPSIESLQNNYEKYFYDPLK
ncbi:MAG: transporter substrate-binding domain-containing protein [Cellvibrio sp.]